MMNAMEFRRRWLDWVRGGVWSLPMLGLGLTLGLLAFGGAMVSRTAWAQESPPQIVDSLEAHQRRIEGLVDERIRALIPSGDYVMKANVTGTPSRLPRGAVEGTAIDLPGFRPTSNEALPGEARFRVDLVQVRIVINQEIPESDLQYLRTIVPILAEFRPERGDRLDLQQIKAIPKPGSEEAAVAEVIEAGGKPGEEMTPFGPMPKVLGLSWWQWLLIAVLGFFLLMFLIVVWRLVSAFTSRKVHMQEAAAAAAAPKPPPPQKDESAELERERQKLEVERNTNDLKHSVVKRMFARPELGRELIAEWQTSPTKINSLIHAMGPTIARAAILPHVGRERYQELEETVRSERAPDSSKMLSALRDASLFMVSQEITNPEMIRPNPFRFLETLSWGQTAHLIKDEPVNIKAIVLSRIDPAKTAMVLEPLPKDLQLEIAANIGNLHDLPLEMADSVARDLAEKARSVPDARLVDIDGPAALVDLMSRTSSATSRYLLGAMKSKDTKLSQEIEKRFFMFEAIPLVPEEIMPQAVRTLPSSTVVIALQGADTEIARKVIMAFPENARPGFVTALRASRADPEAVEEARRRVVGKFQELGRQGRLDLKQISDAWQAEQSKAS